MNLKMPYNTNIYINIYIRSRGVCVYFKFYVKCLCCIIRKSNFQNVSPHFCTLLTKADAWYATDFSNDKNNENSKFECVVFN